jgi:hypothetical protein
MGPKRTASSFGWIIAVSSAVLLAACASRGSGPRPVAVAPMCTILAETRADNPRLNPRVAIEGRVLVAERVDANVDHGFTPFRGISGPRGNPAIGFTADVYGMSEAWLRRPLSPEVHRAQATPAPRAIPGGTDLNGSAWSMTAQDAMGTWSPVFFVGTANRGDEQDDPVAAALTVPRFMPVGLSNPQMFACAGARTEDGAERTTWLIESMAPNAARGIPFGRVDLIQDLLNGDAHFVPNAPGPLVGPATPPTPTISGPGNPIRNGSVQCAMTQLDDQLTTRELHMLGIHNGVLYHSMANNFGPVTRGTGSTFSRFRTISPWGDVGRALGGGFGTIVSAAIVASRPRAVSVFFVAESGGRYRLWHAVRFSATNRWRPVDDVLAVSGDAPNGSVYAYRVFAGTCPALGAAVWDAQSTEGMVALLGGPNQFEVLVIRVLSTPQQWRPGVSGIYSPWRHLGVLGRGVDPARRFGVQGLVVVGRPFRDDARPRP